MAQVINTNVQSINAQRNLSNSQKMLGNTLERLSTGLRINSAKDDAAGLAISERFTAQIKGLNQAVRNANDGISFSQTAEAALSTVGSNLQRIRELAVQSTNGSNSAGDRNALNNEVKALISEVSRVALNTEFNGRSILDGTTSNAFFQVGSNQGQMIAVSGVDSRTSQLGSTDQVGAYISQADVEALASTGATIGAITLTTADSTAIATTGGSESLEAAVSDLNKAIQTAIDGGDKAVADAGYRAFVRVDNAGNSTIAVTANKAATGWKVEGGAITDTDNKVTATTLEGATTAAAAKDLTDLDILTRETATQAIGIVDGALNQINSMRAEMGAVQTRFDQAISNLSVSSENMSAARSRIRDADFAAETAELTRVQILQQAGISVLSQANAAPQSALSLLQ
ncbi:flagellin N-terminal helical domain-containing protein [Thiorhodovibrio litoralis]|uniref:flagellin N-terminal helical domain-containing protein n=1 Tax=Thiorhodovibrio litoralis TaxID=2952932 RepID=UPI002B2576C4|nr:flagellin [Thiorhodovibrio litoralis]WPL11577.1 A-type flagellin [Thiorhodovibrio litoralis]